MIKYNSKLLYGLHVPLHIEHRYAQPFASGEKYRGGAIDGAAERGGE
jgi:hypothetical protein